MKDLTPIKKIDIRTQTAQAIQDHIILNNFHPGEKLPSERALAEMLNIGRNTLREALRTLEAIGIVEVVNGKGIFVKKVNKNAINLQIEATKVNFLELLEIRRVLEDLVIVNVVNNATENNFDTIKKKLALLKKACEERENIEECDTDFHHAIYKANGSRTLYELIKPTSETFRELWGKLRTQTEYENVFLDTYDFHNQLYEALYYRNIHKAQEIMHKILDYDKEIVSQLTKEK